MALTGKDLVALIRACSAYGVTHFEAGDVKVTFGHAPQHQLIAPKSKVSQADVEKTEEELKTLREEQERDETFFDDPADFERRFAMKEHAA